MTENVEFLKKMKADLPGEINGVKEYAALAKMAKDSGEDCAAIMINISSPFPFTLKEVSPCIF